MTENEIVNSNDEQVEKEEAVISQQEVAEEPIAKAEVEVLKLEEKAEVPASSTTYVKKEINPIEDFDWDSIGKKDIGYPKDVRIQMETMYDDTLRTVVDHEVVDGKIVGLTSREAIVNIGFKSDGVIPLNELRYNPNFKVGDTVEVYIESQEDSSGQLLLSHRKARTMRSWERVNSAMEKDEIINGYVKCRTKGGLIVDVFGIEAFLPGSQIDVKPIRDYDVYVGKTMEFKVVKINNEYKNVVVSHKALIEAELEIQKAEIIAKLEKGQILEGTVKNITSYGVFIDLGGVDGLIHITDLSWGRINHPEEIVTLDEKINVVILDFDDSKKRIALGLKQLQSHPWDSLDENLKQGDTVKGRVVVIADYGAFIEIAAGVEGLIHVSEMSWSQHLRSAQEFLNINDEVEAVILTLDREERKMSLGLKQLKPDPWANIMEKFPVGSKHKALVRNFTNFGVFVELEEGVDGLIHISDLSWSKKIKHPAEFTKVGEEIEVVVLDLDQENRRLSLGHKQLEENPWEVFETLFSLGSIHEGTIINESDKGLIVMLPYGVEAFSPAKHSVKEDKTKLRVDDKAEFKVIEFSKEQKKIIVSHSRIFEDAISEQKEAEDATEKAADKATKKATKKIKDSMEKTTLGDLDVLSNLKSEMEEVEKTQKKAKVDAMISNFETRQEEGAATETNPTDTVEEVPVAELETEATVQDEVIEAEVAVEETETVEQPTEEETQEPTAEAEETKEDDTEEPKA